MSQMHSGDFDLVTAFHEEVGTALLRVGFRREDRPGWRQGGYYHPTLPIGVEFVSGLYFDGRADRQRIRLVDVGAGDVPMAATEDMIADRLGQWVAGDRRDPELRVQAHLLYALAEAPDDAYLSRRIREETAGELDISDLKNGDDETHHPGGA